MYLRNYIKLLFIVIITTSVALFVYSAYALFSGRAMEKEFTNITKGYDKETAKTRTALTEANFTEYERKMLSTKYDVNFVLPNMCYLGEDPKKTQEQNAAIKKYNEDCKAKGVPESTIRPEVEESYSNWANIRKDSEGKKDEINSRLYADNSGKGKMDREMINTFAIVAGVGIILSMILLLIFVRVPKEEKESKTRSKKDE